MIELRALGTLALRDPNGEDLHSVLAQPKRVALLAYLAIARPRGFQRRDTLLALLWPELDEQHARGALNQALRHLRTALGKEAVPSRGDGEIGIDVRALSCDAVEFEAAIEADDPARALGLYRGDLLDGFHVSGWRGVRALAGGGASLAASPGGAGGRRARPLRGGSRRTGGRGPLGQARLRARPGR